MSEKKRGWGLPVQARKYHYFNGELRSLCGGWMFASDDLYDTQDDHADNCAACRRAVAALRKRESDTTPTGAAATGVGA